MISVPERVAGPEEGLKKSFDNYDFNLRCASPGIIQSFNAETLTVEVLIAISEKIKCNSPEFIEEYGTNVAFIPIPVLVDVPIVIPSAGGFSLTVPVTEGDECLVIFSDTCFDAWFELGCPDNEPQEAMMMRRHDLSDGFAILGIKSKPMVVERLSNYSTEAIQMRNASGETIVSLSDEEIVLKVGDKGIVITEDGVEIEGLMFMEHKHLGVTVGGELTQGVSPI